MSEYRTLSQKCPKCGKQVPLYSVAHIDNAKSYSYICPQCDTQTTFKGSVGIKSDKIPKNAVPIKPM